MLSFFGLELDSTEVKNECIFHVKKMKRFTLGDGSSPFFWKMGKYCNVVAGMRIYLVCIL
ncbi:hypothetical protein SAMN06265379_101505 [Saccharicrinis carchari]|uniref:Uncharacterized protein n=1 Tax=Saccharicrinis carchari TaxID=1168039 RepID=A0A521AX86_SACCC|nr:hypothetical protein SAMN06265379_101505 [Saccharicrinis carchari]